MFSQQQVQLNHCFNSLGSWRSWSHPEHTWQTGQTIDNKSVIHWCILWLNSVRFPKISVQPLFQLSFTVLLENIIQQRPSFTINCLQVLCVCLGSWSLQFEFARKVCVLRSLLWFGLTFYHVPMTPQHGYIYIGDGTKNLDLPFML